MSHSRPDEELVEVWREHGGLPPHLASAFERMSRDCSDIALNSTVEHRAALRWLPAGGLVGSLAALVLIVALSPMQRDAPIPSEKERLAESAFLAFDDATSDSFFFDPFDDELRQFSVLEEDV